MEVKKIISLSEAEIEKLTEAGKILGNIRDVFQTTKADEMDNESLELFRAIFGVTQTIASYALTELRTMEAK